MSHTTLPRKTLSIILLILFCTASPVSAGINRWSSLGPEGGYIFALTIDPLNPTTLYAATLAGGVFKSTDGGGSWNPANTGLANFYVTDLAIDPRTPSTLYAVTIEGVYKTVNGGGNWFALSSGHEGEFVYLRSLEIDPITPTTLYAWTSNSIWKSLDGGAAWSPANSGLSSYDGGDALAIDPLTPTTLYTAIDDDLFKSTNGGGSWSELDADLGAVGGIADFVIDPQTPSTIYALTKGSNLHKSTDGGLTWYEAHNDIPGNANDLVIDPRTPGTLYVATRYYNGGVWKSTDGGESWFAANNGMTTDITGLPHATGRSLAIDPQNPDTLYAGLMSLEMGFDGGIFKTTDGGENWIPASTNLMNSTINTLAIDPAAPNTLYAGSMHTGVNKSTDGGGSWSKANTGLGDLRIYVLLVDPQTPATLYAGTGSLGIFKTTDGGASWNAANTGLDSFNKNIRAMAIDPLTPSTLYAGTNAGVVKSTDGGGHWNAADNGLTDESVKAIVINPLTPTTLYAGTDRDGVYKSTDGGEYWEAVNTGMEGVAGGYMIESLAIDPAAPDTLYAGTAWIEGKGVFKTTDGGETWRAINAGLPTDESDNVLPITALAVDPTMPSTVYLGLGSGPGSQTYPELEGGVFKSTNGGESWSAVDTGLTDFYVNALALSSASPGILYAATVGGGVYTIRQAPTLAINYPSGAPGSYFTVTGSGFPPDGTISLTVNGILLGTAPVDSAGGVSFILSTSLTTQTGYYHVTAAGGPAAATHFILENGGIIHPQAGSGTVFNMPGGIAHQVLYLPAAMK